MASPGLPGCSLRPALAVVAWIAGVPLDEDLLPLAQYRAQRTLYCSTRRHTPCGGWSTTCATTLRSPQLAKRREVVLSHLAERDRAARPEAGAATHARRCSGSGRAR